MIKNETRNLQKEISNLQTSINSLKYDLHQTTLDHEIITSPENISRLAKEYLEFDLVTYKKSQIKQLNEKAKNLTELKETKHKKTFKIKNKKLPEKIKLQIVRKIEQTKIELRKLQQLYSAPKKLPGEIKIQIAKTIETKKKDLKKLYSEPQDSIDLGRVKRWSMFQVAKVFLGIPVVPGK